MLLRDIGDMLAARESFAPGTGGIRWGALPLAIVAGALFYGAVMGAYGLRPLQMLYSSVKVPFLITISGLVCLPNLVVLNTILGLRQDFGAVLRGLAMAQGTVCMSLAALAPLTAVAYLSSDDYGEAVLFNGIMFLAASLAGQVTLSRHYRPLIERDPKHRIARDMCLGLYVFVAIQMAWVLRPFVGDPEQPTSFFRPGAWSNAYVEVADLLWREIRR